MDFKKQSNFNLNPFWDFWGPILFTVFLYIGIRQYLAEARYIPSGSMLPTLQIQDRLIIEKLSIKKRFPKRGEIIVFKSPFSFDSVLSDNKRQPKLKCILLNFPLISFIPSIREPACDAYIKRVVALPGDLFQINSKGQLFISNNLVKEPYVKNFCTSANRTIGNCPVLQSKVPNGHVLVLGDNRSNSWDGRFWPGGPFLPVNQIIGRAVWRFWPSHRIGGLHL